MKTKTFHSDKKGYSFLLSITTLLTAAVIGALKYVLDKLEIMYPQLFEQERALPEIIIYGAIIVFFAAYVVFAVIFLRIWHRSLSYEITEHEIISHAGFITKTKQIMKISSIQYVTKISMPFSSMNSFNFVIVSALGGRLMMMFLSDSDSSEIISMLKALSSEQEYAFPSDTPPEREGSS